MLVHSSTIAPTSCALATRASPASSTSRHALAGSSSSRSCSITRVSSVAALGADERRVGGRADCGEMRRRQLARVDRDHADAAAGRQRRLDQRHLAEAGGDHRQRAAPRQLVLADRDEAAGRGEARDPGGGKLVRRFDEAVDQGRRQAIRAHHLIDRRLLDDPVAHRKREGFWIANVADHPRKAGVEHDDAQGRHLGHAVRLLRHDPSSRRPFRHAGRWRATQAPERCPGGARRRAGERARKPRAAGR